MFSALKNHPFGVSAFFDYSLVLTFAVPKAALQAMMPECLALDTLRDEWAFVAVVMVQTKSLRPKGFPAFLGNDFFLIGYRIFVRYTTAAGKRLRGLYILKSETDRKKMEWLGNIFTHYRYTTTDIQTLQQGGILKVSSRSSGFEVEAITANPAAQLPPASPFADWKEARRFAGPLPFTFTYNPEIKEVLIVEGVREHWVPAPVEVLRYRFSFLDAAPFKDAVLANAFIIRDIPYHWKKGRTEKWTAPESHSRA